MPYDMEGAINQTDHYINAYCDDGTLHAQEISNSL